MKIGYEKGEQVESAMKAVAPWISKDSSVKIKYHKGTQVSADIFKKIIHLPRFGTLDNDSLVKYRSWLYHEAGHIKETILEKSEYPKRGARHKIFNAIEDVRMQRRIADQFKGARMAFRFSWDFYNKDIGKKISEGEITHPLFEALCAMEFTVEGYNPAWKLTPQAQKYFDIAYPIFIRVNTIKSAKASVRLAEEIYELLKEEKKKQDEESKGKGNQKSKQKNQSEESEEEEQECDPDMGGDYDTEADYSFDDDEESEESGSEVPDDDFDEDDNEKESEGHESSSGGEENEDEDMEDDEEGNSGSGTEDDEESDEKEGSSSNNDDSDEESNDNIDSESKKNSKGNSEEDDDNEKEELEKEDSDKKSDEEIEQEMDDESEGAGIDEVLADEISDAIEELDPLDREYCPYKDNDVFEIPSVTTINCEEYTKRRQEVAASIMGMSRALEQALRTMAMCRKNPYREIGKIDMKRLVDIAKSLNTRVFYTETTGRKLDVACSIVIDESGSMGNWFSVQLLAIALGETLNSIRVPFEIVGATTVYCGGNTPPLNEFSRTNPIRYKFYKTFGEEWMHVRPRITNSSSHHHHIDGEVVEMVAMRLSNRHEGRKVVFSLSDGLPCSGHRGNIDEIMARNLKRVCERSRQNGVEVYGFGLGTTDPKRYYGNDYFVYLQSVDELNSCNFFRRFANILTRGEIKI